MISVLYMYEYRTLQIHAHAMLYVIYLLIPIILLWMNFVVVLLNKNLVTGK